MPDTSLCVRLRRERERRRIPLSSISSNTKISAALFEALERGDVSRWPSGIFRRSFIRAYASAIGLDPDATAREFLEQFPDPLDPPPVAPAAAPVAPLAAPAASVIAAAKATDASGIRLKLADAPPTFARGRLLDGMRRRWAAVGCDAGIVVAIALCVFVVCDRFWLPLGVAMLAYYLGGILLLGNTPGVCLFAPEQTGAAHYNRPLDERPHADARAGSERTRPESEPAHPAWHIRMPAR